MGRELSVKRPVPGCEQPHCLEERTEPHEGAATPTRDTLHHTCQGDQLKLTKHPSLECAQDKTSQLHSSAAHLNTEKERSVHFSHTSCIPGRDERGIVESGRLHETGSNYGRQTVWGPQGTGVYLPLAF